MDVAPATTLLLRMLITCYVCCRNGCRSWPTLDAYVSDSWAVLSGRAQTQSACVGIPRNFTLCHGIDYDQMRLPNLLEHETLDEAVQQAMPWIPLLRLNCHSDTQLFLCSLFAPVCLERSIYPCRSLCEGVKTGCEKRMQMYGFPWPDMLDCDKFPIANDMCIQPREVYRANQSCPPCNQISTYENILDHFCQSDYVLKVKLHAVANDFVEVKRGKALKPRDMGAVDNLKGLKLRLTESNQSCPCQVAKDGIQKRFIAMANRTKRGEYLLNLILPWKKEKQFKRALRMFRKLDCKALGPQMRDRARREHSRATKRIKQVSRPAPAAKMTKRPGQQRYVVL